MSKKWETKPKKGLRVAVLALLISLSAISKQRWSITSFIHVLPKRWETAGEGSAYAHFGIAHKCLGDFKTAIQYYKLHLSITKEVGDRAGEGRAYANLSIAYDSLGNFQTAIEYHQLHFTFTEQVGDREGTGRAYTNLGRVFCVWVISRKPLSITENI